LVVDDEPLVAAMIRLLLESAGHGVTLCLEGQQALEAFQRSHYDVALVDLGLPRLDGWEVSRQINRIRPDVPVIVATGWSTTVADAEGRGAVVRAVLRKPFGMRELAGAIIEATGGGANEIRSSLIAPIDRESSTQTGPHPL
jgi:DNA-binding response OmpR family regulator